MKSKKDLRLKHSINSIISNLLRFYPDFFRIENDQIFLVNKTLDHHCDNKALILDDNHTFCIILRSISRTLDNGPVITIVLDLYETNGHFEMGEDLELKPDVCVHIYKSGMDIQYLNREGILETYDQEAIMRKWTIENIIL